MKNRIHALAPLLALLAAACDGGAPIGSGGSGGGGGSGGEGGSGGGGGGGSGGSGASAGSGGAGASGGSGGSGGSAASGGTGGTGGAAGGAGGSGGAPTFCVPGATQPCYSGPGGTQGVGDCHDGVTTCLADGSGFGPCVGELLPSAEVCSDGGDEDCDGVSNEADAGCACIPGEQAACYSGPAGTEGVGTCKAGWHFCNADGLSFSGCVNEILPQNEICGDHKDNDCNGFACGEAAWALAFPPPQAPNIDDEIQRVAAGTGGELFSVTRRGSTLSLGSPFYLVRKHAPDGAVLWEKTLVASGLSTIGGVAYDPFEGLTVTGWFGGNGSLTTAAGTVLSTGNATGASFRVQLDELGAEVAASTLQIFTLATPYDTRCEGVDVTSGSEQIACRALSPGLDFATVGPAASPFGALVLSAQEVNAFESAALPGGGFAIAGAYKGALKQLLTTLCPDTGTADWFVARVDANAAIQWVKCFGTTQNDQGMQLAVTSAGEIVVAVSHSLQLTVGGKTWNPDPGGSTNTAIAFFDGAGAVVKTASVMGAGPQTPVELVADDEGQVYGLFYTEGQGNIGGALIEAGPVLAAFSAIGPTWQRSLGVGAPELWLGALAVHFDEPTLAVGGIGYGDFSFQNLALSAPAVSGAAVLAKMGR